MSEELLVLVDEHDRELGVDTRENCHRGAGKRHRAFVVFLFRGKELLLQRRAEQKLWGGCWDLSYTSHVLPGEDYHRAAARRGRQELGIEPIPLTRILEFTYQAIWPTSKGQYSENEFCVLLLGQYDGGVTPQPGEISAIRYARLPDILRDLERHPERYTPWFERTLQEFRQRPEAASFLS
jgi:isopentenyl-diphosphate delta-isomerase